MAYTASLEKNVITLLILLSNLHRLGKKKKKKGIIITLRILWALLSSYYSHLYNADYKYTFIISIYLSIFVSHLDSEEGR